MIVTEYRIHFIHILILMVLMIHKKIFLNQIQNYECKTFLQGYLNIEDKLSMANGLETRVPFLENDFFEYAMNLNHKQKIKIIKNKSIINGKIILRELLKKTIYIKCMQETRICSTRF